MGINATGTTDPNFYQLGRGIVYVSLLNSAGLPIAYRDVGNATEFNVTVESESLEHRSSRAGLQVVDKEVTISQKATLNLTIDEIDFNNLAMFFSGETAAHVNVAVAGFTSHVMVPTGTLQHGRWYEIKNAAGERAYDVTAGDVALATTNATPVPLVLGTDYTLNAEMGTFFLLPGSSVVTTAISGNEGLTCVLTAKPGANAVSEVRGLTQTSITAAVKFISENPANDNRRREYQFHRVNLQPEGDFALIGDEFTTMTFTGAAEANAAADADSPTVTVRAVAE